MKGSLRILLALVAVVALVAMSGCGAIVERAVKGGVESATGVKVDESNNSVSVQAKDGSLNMSNDGKLPEGFPEDMPVYENGKITTGMMSESDNGKAFTVSISTDDAADTVFDWYVTQLKDKGWTVTTTMKTDKGGILGGEKGDQVFTVGIGAGSSDEDKTAITISVSPK